MLLANIYRRYIYIYSCIYGYIYTGYIYMIVTDIYSTSASGVFPDGLKFKGNPICSYQYPHGL